MPSFVRSWKASTRMFSNKKSNRSVRVDNFAMPNTYCCLEPLTFYPDATFGLVVEIADDVDKLG